MTTSKTPFFLVLTLFITSFHNNKCWQNSFPLKLVRLSDEASAFKVKVVRKKHVLPNYPRLALKYPSMALIASLPIGTPSQNIQMVLDTGSQVMWMACDVTNPKASFQHSRSHTFSYLTCNNKRDTCSITDNTLGVSCNRITHQCGYSYFYADGTLAKGIFVKENFTFSASQTTPSLILGCTHEADSSGAGGILGMNLGALSFISQLNLQTFSYCVPNHGKNNTAGRLYLGPNPDSRSFDYVGLSKPPQGYHLPNYDYLAYSVPWLAINITGKRLSIPGVDHNGSGQTIIDSGSQYTYLDDVVYSKLKEQVLRLARFKIKRYIHQDLDLCFNGNSGEIGNLIGDMVFEFGNHTSVVKVLISKGKIFDDVDRGVSCFTIVSSSLLGYNIIGNFHQQNNWVEYDVKNNRVGFGSTPDCNK